MIKANHKFLHSKLPNYKFGKTGKSFLFAIISLFVSCEFTPKGGGNLLVSQSITESREKGMFCSEFQPIKPCFEYRDSIVNIKICFKEVFSEYFHKEIRRIPTYDKPRYVSWDDEQFVVYTDLNKSILNGNDSLWHIEENGGVECFTLRQKINAMDTVVLQILSSYAYEEKLHISKKNRICLGEIKFVRKK